MIMPVVIGAWLMFHNDDRQPMAFASMQSCEAVRSYMIQERGWFKNVLWCVPFGEETK